MLASPASSSAVTNSRYYPHSSPPMPIPSFLPATSRSGRSSLSDSHEPSWLYVLPRLETNAVAQRPSYDWQRSHPMRNSTYSHRGPPSPPSDASSSLRDSTSPTTTGGMTAVTEASVDASARCSTKTNFAGSADTTSTSIRLGRKRKRLQRVSMVASMVGGVRSCHLTPVFAFSPRLVIPATKPKDAATEDCLAAIAISAVEVAATLTAKVMRSNRRRGQGPRQASLTVPVRSYGAIRWDAPHRPRSTSQRLQGLPCRRELLRTTQTTTSASQPSI